MARLNAFLVAFALLAPSPASAAPGEAGTEEVLRLLEQRAGDELLIAQEQRIEQGNNGLLMIVPPDDDMIYFDKPIGIGPVPVNGRSIEELIRGKPLFSPIEGLDKSLWEKDCSSCHQWNRESLCDQGKTYAGQNIRLVLRHPHPYGGPFKLAITRWAAKGCQ